MSAVPNPGSALPCARLSTSAFLVLAVALWVVARALPVLALSEVFFFGEELEKGAVAALLRAKFSGALDVPWTSLPYHPYEGGGFCASHLKALAFALVGENVLAHKLCALAWGALVLGAAFAFARRHLGEPSARWLALLLVAAPAHVQRASLLHLGIHFEALVFVFAVLQLGLALARAPRSEPWSRRTLFALGLVGGFGLWFSYQLALPLALVGVALLGTRPRAVLGRDGLVGLAGFALGATPLWVMLAAVGQGVFDLHGAAVGGVGGFARLATFAPSLGGALAHDPVALAQTSALAVLAGLGLAGLAKTRGARVVGLTLLAYLVLWLALAGWSGLVPKAYGHWFALLRWAPPVVVVLTLAAAGAGQGALRFGRVRLGAALACVAVMAGAVQTVRITAEGELGRAGAHWTALRTQSGCAWLPALVKLVPRWPGAGAGVVAPLVAAAPRLAPGAERERAFLCAIAAGYATTRTEGFDALAAALAALRPADAGARAAFSLGLGRALAAEAGEGGGAEGWHALGRLPTPTDERAEALGRFGSGWVVFPAFLATELAAVRGAPGAAAYRRGLGARAYDSFVAAPFGRLGGHAFVLRPERVRAWVTGTTTPEEAADVLAGFDAAARAGRR